MENKLEWEGMVFGVLGFLEAFRALLGFMYRAMSKPVYERVKVGVKRVHLEVLPVG